MKRWFFCGIICMLFLAAPFVSMADDSLVEADMLFEKGDITSALEAISLYVKAVEANPDSYEANWKCARGHWSYADKVFQQSLDGWKDICKRYGKDGMKYGEKAIELAPIKIEGNYYYGLCVKSYADSVSIFTALKEGLKGSTQKAFEAAYEADKMYDRGGPIKALGRFWFVLPWPLTDTKSSLRYFEEHQKYFPEDTEGQVWYAEVLIDKNMKDLAKPLLEKAVASNHPYYSKQAKDLMRGF